MKYLKINPADNVAVALEALQAGEHILVDGVEISLNADIPMGHKFALANIDEKAHVVKYGYPIGHARSSIQKGDWVNETNIKTLKNVAGAQPIRIISCHCDAPASDSVCAISPIQ